MYEIRFSILADKKLNGFLWQRKHYYKNKFSDTWIFNEKEILGSILLSIDNFNEDLLTFIEKNLETWFLGEIEGKTTNYEQRKIVLFFKSYTLILTTKKWLAEKVITIEDIIIKT